MRRGRINGKRNGSDARIVLKMCQLRAFWKNKEGKNLNVELPSAMQNPCLVRLTY